MIDVTELTDDELVELRRAATNEQARRAIVASAASEVDKIAGQYQDAMGRKDGDTWQQPTGALDAYSRGAVVEHRGRVYMSHIINNVTEPGNPNDPQAYRWWADITDDGEEEEETDGNPKWSGEGVAYEVGDLREFEGTTYRCLQGHTSQPGWTPTAVPALWDVV